MVVTANGEVLKAIRRGTAVLLLTFSFCAGALSYTARAAEDSDPNAGRSIFKKCASCHQIGPEARNRVGPHLNELFGRRAGAVAGVKYSKDMIRAGANGLIWTREKLDAYIENPKALVSGTRMQFRGVKRAKDRADLLAYLRQYSANPRDIPESEPTADAASHDPAVDPEILQIQGDPAYGEYLAGECVTCHQPSGTDKGIPSIVGWPTDIFVTAMHAYKKKIRENQVMQMVAGPLNDEEIASLAAYFEGLDQQ